MRVNGHRRKRIGGVPKVPRAHETGREPDEQRGQHAHHHEQPDDVAQRDHWHFGRLVANACAQRKNDINILSYNDLSISTVMVFILTLAVDYVLGVTGSTRRTPRLHVRVDIVICITHVSRRRGLTIILRRIIHGFMCRDKFDIIKTIIWG